MTRYVIALTGAILAALSLFIVVGASHAASNCNRMLRRYQRECAVQTPTPVRTATPFQTQVLTTDCVRAGQSGSVTYRPCACADTGSSIEADNAILSLTE